jgi:hypothetical protein
MPDQAERGNMPDAVLEQGVELAVVRPLGVEQRQRKDGGQLHRLFLDGHRAQQLLRALHRGGGGGARGAPSPVDLCERGVHDGAKQCGCGRHEKEVAACE